MDVKEKNNDNFYSDVESVLLNSTNVRDEKYDLSIMIPTYRRNKYLMECLDSAVHQKPSNCKYEIVVINNELDADFELIVEKYSKYSNVFFYANEKNIGMCGNINRCAVLARSEFYAVLHDDDLLKEDYVLNMWDILKKYGTGKVGAIIAERDYIYHEKNDQIIKSKSFKNQIKSLIRKLYPEVTELTPKIVLKSWIKNYYLAPTCGTVFNREIFMNFGGYQECEYPYFDMSYFLRMNNEYNCYRANKILGTYRWINNASFMHDARVNTCAFRISLINYNYKDKELSNFFYRYNDILISMELKKYSVTEQNEIINRTGESIKSIPTNLFIAFKISNFVYRILHGTV